MFHTTFGKTRAKSYGGGEADISNMRHQRLVTTASQQSPVPPRPPGWRTGRDVMMDTCRSSSLSEEFMHHRLCECVCVCHSYV